MSQPLAFALEARPSYPVVPTGTTTVVPADGRRDIVGTIVDTYVESHPDVVAARDRYRGLNRVHDALLNVSVPGELFGGLGTLMSAFAGVICLAGDPAVPHAWVPITGLLACSAVGGLGLYLDSAAKRLWKHGLQPARDQLEATRAKVRDGLDGPDAVKEVAERLAARDPADGASPA